MNPSILTTPRFLKAFEDANALLKKKVYSEVHQFVDYFRADPVKTASRYKTFRGVEPYTVLKSGSIGSSGRWVYGTSRA